MNSSAIPRSLAFVASAVMALSIFGGEVSAQTKARTAKSDPPVVGRWYRLTNGRKVNETLQIEAKGGVTYTREWATNKRVKTYGSWKRSGTTIIVKLPIKDGRKSDEKGIVMRVVGDKLVPNQGIAWIRARK